MTEKAETDLTEIWSYVAAEVSAATATRLLAAILRTCKPLLKFPLAAPGRSFAPGLRVAFSGAYAIYFVADEHEVVVVRVLHGSRDASALAARGGFKI